MKWASRSTWSSDCKTSKRSTLWTLRWCTQCSRHPGCVTSFTRQCSGWKKTQRRAKLKKPSDSCSFRSRWRAFQVSKPTSTTLPSRSSESKIQMASNLTAKLKTRTIKRRGLKSRHPKETPKNGSNGSEKSGLRRWWPRPSWAARIVHLRHPSSP